MGEKEIAASLEVLGGLAALQAQPERAVRLAGAAAALRERVGLPMTPEDQSFPTDLIAQARRALTPEAQRAAWAVGQAMTLEQAISAALDAPPSPSGAQITTATLQR
jgi:hypothetical protein